MAAGLAVDFAVVFVVVVWVLAATAGVALLATGSDWSSEGVGPDWIDPTSPDFVLADG